MSDASPASQRIRTKGQEVPGTMHCKDPQYEHLMNCSCLDCTAKEVQKP